ncbi:signal peptide peptidase SppA [Deinococcus yavapaiensis]|uniref:Signal peptide peptidase A n=1 Tax=Deinococcus yavapaiensis KR-236 TaxID=694435 RepID=A0A318SE18_9DEIO|nr:signal peptide peptidase SppA [Deinococcus yavapaiensis]PYE54762.1 signal peptide peptidase A [Deinococcus yavapaiensis KR-236]
MADMRTSPIADLLSDTLNLPTPEKLPTGLKFPTWVILDVAGKYPSRAPSNPLQQLVTRADTLESFDKKIDALVGAPWLHGVLVRFGDLEVGGATAWHMRRSLQRLSKEKRTVAYATRLDMLTLLVASGSGELTLPESADIDVTGFTTEITFLGAFLHKHGVAFDVSRVKEYKSALSPLAQDRMDDFDRSQREELLASFEAEWVRDVAEARGVSGDEVLSWLARGVASANEAKALGMIDRVAYEDELIGPGTRPFSSVAMALKPKKTSGKGRVAVVSVVGTIVPGKSRNNPLPLFGGVQAGSDSVVAAIRRAKKDASTKAIVLYVDSPGGSPLAADLMWRELSTCDKPVVAVMGNVAASAGYYIPVAAKRIVAAPNTITGSIGVIAGKPVLEEFNERQGFRPERVTRSAFPGLYSASSSWTERERDFIDRSILEIYDRFVDRVAQGRGLSHERVNEVGRGRVWTGADAVKIGLVDELGDLRTGIERACELAGLSYDAPVWSADPRRSFELPEVPKDAAALLVPSILLRERALMMLDASYQIR